MSGASPVTQRKLPRARSRVAAARRDSAQQEIKEATEHDACEVVPVPAPIASFREGSRAVQGRSTESVPAPREAGVFLLHQLEADVRGLERETRALAPAWLEVDGEAATLSIGTLRRE